MSAVIALAAGGRIVGVERASVAVIFFTDVCHSEVPRGKALKR